MKVDMMQTLDLNTTISVLQQDISSISIDEAMALIDNWHQQLQGTDIAQKLIELKQILIGGNTGSISKMLVDIGENISVGAANSTDDVAANVQKLGNMLIQAGNSLM
ncbi:MAG TPA: hypothetical protein V6D09_26050 [Leptolyngbyaceae cyanobacterium]